MDLLNIAICVVRINNYWKAKNDKLNYDTIKRFDYCFYGILSKNTNILYVSIFWFISN